MNDKGRKYAIQRLADAPTKATMRAVFCSLGNEYRQDIEIVRITKELAEGKPEA